MRALLVSSVVAISGCATSLGMMQSAVPVAPRHVEVSGGAGFYAPVGQLVSAIQQGEKHADAIRRAAKNQERYEVTEEQLQALLTSGIALAVFPPSAQFELSARTGVVPDVDVGLRY